MGRTLVLHAADLNPSTPYGLLNTEYRGDPWIESQEQALKTTSFPQNNKKIK